MAAGADWPLVLAYHHVTAERVASRYAVTADDLESQLGGLLGGGYSAMALDEAVRVGEFGTGERPERTFTVTFDDSFASFRELAYPVLARLGLAPATTVFVPTAFVGKQSAWIAEPPAQKRAGRADDFPEPCMTWSDLSALADDGVRIGSHGHRHLPMNSLTYDDALEEARASHDALVAHRLGADYLALPYGWTSEPCRAAIADAGFSIGFAVERGGGDRFEIRRIPVYGSDSRVMLRLKFSGRYFAVHDSAARLVGRGRRT